jgi:hypothetical protein
LRARLQFSDHVHEFRRTRVIPRRHRIRGSWSVDLYRRLAFAIFKVTGAEIHLGRCVKTVTVVVAPVNLARAGSLVRRERTSCLAFSPVSAELVPVGRVVLVISRIAAED